jgi:ABC-2 type transport system permease protein
MTKTLLVMFAEIRTSLRRKTYVFFAFVLPLILGLIAFVVALTNPGSGQHLQSPMASVAQSATISGALPQGFVDLGGLVQILPDDLPAGRLVRYPDQVAAQGALERGVIAGYFVVRPDYVKSGSLTYVVQEHNPLLGTVDDSLVGRVLAFNLIGGDPVLSARLAAPLVVQNRPLLASGAQEVEDSWVVELLPTLVILMLYMAILIPAGTLVNAFTDEKKNRVIEVLLTSVTTQQLVTGKIVALGLLGLVQVALYVGVLGGVVRFGGAPLRVPPGFALPSHLLVWTLIYFLGGYAIYGALLAGVGALAPDVKDSRSTNLMVMAPLILSYMFLIVITERPDSPLALFLSLFPLTSPIAIIGRMTVTAVPFWQSVLAVALQFLAAIFVIRLVARLFRAQHLLSGQPISPQSYLKTLLHNS